MELAWITDLPIPVKPPRDSSVMGRTRFFGPITFGSFRYLDSEGGGFWFINIRGTRFGICREWS